MRNSYGVNVSRVLRGGIRLFSLDRRLQRTANGEVDRFEDMLTYWRSKDGPFGNTPPSNWRTLLERLS
jgi:intracellular multiplication protein IcmJ